MLVGFSTIGKIRVEEQLIYTGRHGNSRHNYALLLAAHNYCVARDRPRLTHWGLLISPTGLQRFTNDKRSCWTDVEFHWRSSILLPSRAMGLPASTTLRTCFSESVVKIHEGRTNSAQTGLCHGVT